MKWYWEEKTEVLHPNPIAVPLGPPQTLHDKASNHTVDSAMSAHRLTNENYAVWAKCGLVTLTLYGRDVSVI